MGLAMTQRRQDYDEKRNYIRMKIAAPMSITITQSNGSQVNATCVDLSGGGALIQARQEDSFSLNDHVEIEARSEYNHSPTLHASAQVVRVQQESTHQMVGLKILEVFN